MEILEFSKLFSSGGYSFPVLVELKHKTKTKTWNFTNNNFDLYMGENVYKAVPMSYKYPTSTNGVPQGGTLEIDIDIQDEEGNELLEWFDTADDQVYIEVTGLINEQGELVKVNQLKQMHGNVTWDGEKITWNLGVDDRLNMQVNPYEFNEDALMGYEDEQI